MTSISRWTGRAVILAAISASSAFAQPVQFKANVRMKDGSDGSTSTGVMYFGGSKTRTELTKDGENMVILAEPASRSQTILMPGDKMYMQMPIGEGPVSIPSASRTAVRPSRPFAQHFTSHLAPRSAND